MKSGLCGFDGQDYLDGNASDPRLLGLIDMRIGVVYSELYADPSAQVWDYARAGGFRARQGNYCGPSNLYEFLLALNKEGEHGQAFAALSRVLMHG